MTYSSAPSGDLTGLPRSVRWRIQLGLLVDPAKLDPTSSTTLEYVFKWNEELISQQKARFNELMEKYVEEEEEEGSPEQEEADNKAAEVDPLTAMVMEQEARETRKAELLLKYRKERARRKRGLTVEAGTSGGESDGIDRASLVIIEKDLKRLPHPTATGQAASPNLTPELEERITSLREILYIYSQEHPHMGYRQGMHEIASYLLFCLEQEQPQYPDNPLFTPIMPICFVLLERTLDQLQTAYDASGDQSLQQMSHSILSKIHQNDPPLYHHLTTCPNIPPPPIYCTRWVRLLFSREVVGYENVFKLWDVFFEYNVMRVLEVTSACRVLLLRDALLNPENNPLDLLMNVPQLSDITQLTTSLRRLMRQKDADDPIELPPSQLLPIAPSPQKESPLHQPMAQTMAHQRMAHPLQGPMGTPQNTFNFSKVRQALGQKGESLRKKIITTTNEWKDAAKRESSDNLSATSPNSDMLATASEALRNHSASRRPTETVLFGDPLMHPPVQASPPSPRQHQHEMWSQLLTQRIWTMQQFLMAIESNDGGGTVPQEVWEALADMDRMQHELHNYSRNMAG